MAEEDPHVDVGRLRWPVRIARRAQVPAADGTGITEVFTTLAMVKAAIEAVGALTYYGVEQVDTPITHRIFMRWHDTLDQGVVVVRDTALPNRVPRTEVFRVRRVKELGGRQRFLLIEAELEKRT